MKKIIAGIDGLKYSASTTAYATDIAKHTNAHLVGIFLDDFTYRSYKIYELTKNNGTSLSMLKKMEEKDERTRTGAVKKFELACREAGINYSLHHDRSIASQELLHESIYADLLVIDNKETLTHYEEEIPTRFIRDLLISVQCPVLLVPEKYECIEKVVLLYDGEPSSVHAIKMFNYLLPELLNLQTEVLSVRSTKTNLHLPDNKLMKEFMKRHYPDATFTVLKGLAETEITRNLSKEKQNVLVVLGAYRRGMVSRWFRESMADILMKELKVPLFIAHNK